MSPGTVDPRASLVLVADDVPDARDSCADFLSSRGFRVATAKDGHEAVRLATELRPDVILMDLRMPVMDGLEATRRIREDPRCRGTRVIALTAHAVESTPQEARDAGCCEVLIKPCLPAELEEAVRRSLIGRGERATE